MKTNEFDNIVNDILEEETRKLIKEQIEDSNRLIDYIKNFRSLSGLLDKVTGIENVGVDEIIININEVTPEELVDCCGGKSLGNVQTKLMQRLHHDLEENGFNGNYDIDIETQGNENSLELRIIINTNDDELSNEKDVNEVTDNGELTNTFGQAMYEEEPVEVKDTNPNAEDDKEVILGDKEIDESEEKWIQKAVDPNHEGYCTPMTKDTCTPKRKALAKTFKKMNENTSGKKTITLNQSEMAKLLENIIKEAVESPNITVPANGVPGIDVTRKNHKDSGKENSDALKAVEEKIRNYLKFDGNDDPKSPNQIGQGEKRASVNATDSQDEEIEMNRGRNPADLTYDSEPGEEFTKRAKLSLIGAAEMGNSHEYANVVNPDSKVGENIAKAAEKRKDIRKDEPIYDKEAVPVKNDSKKSVRPAVDDPAVSSDIKRMKQMTGYKEKTQ